MKKSIVLLVLFLIFVLIFGLILINKPSIKLTIDNKEINDDITISYDESFVYPEVSSKIFNKDISKKIKLDGKVDDKKVGTYKLTYKLKYLIYNIKKTINVNIVDLKKPEITLVGSNPGNSCSVQTYVEEGYTAIDEYDGDITDKVTIRKENDTIYYEVLDSSNNKNTIERKINISDTESPNIVLKGNQIVYLKINDEYKEEGYTITDNCDSEITDIQIDNKIDNTKVGSYEINYIVKDSSGNEKSIKRFVYVYDPEVTKNIEGVGTIYLTFDDGPSTYTSKILDILKQYNIKATFFVTKNGKDELIKREYDEGHTVALHTYTHDYKKVYSSVENYFKDLDLVSSRVSKIINEKAMIIRFPGGSSNTVSKNYSKGIMTTLTQEVTNRGYHYFDWTCSVEDAGSCAKKKNDNEKEGCIYNYFTKCLSKNKMNVVLMHDIKYYTANKLEDMIKYAIEQGYTFEKITMLTPSYHHKVNN